MTGQTEPLVKEKKKGGKYLVCGGKEERIRHRPVDKSCKLIFIAQLFNLHLICLYRSLSEWHNMWSKLSAKSLVSHLLGTGATLWQLWENLGTSLGQFWDIFKITLRQLWDTTGTSSRHPLDKSGTILGQHMDNFKPLWDGFGTFLWQLWD